MENTSPITLYRKANGRMSMAAFGERFGVDKSTVLRWERGQLTMRRVLEIEAATGIPRDALLPDFFRLPTKTSKKRKPQ